MTFLKGIKYYQETSLYCPEFLPKSIWQFHIITHIITQIHINSYYYYILCIISSYSWELDFTPIVQMRKSVPEKLSD